MTNDPNDHFMVSDLSSKLSAYINGQGGETASSESDALYNQTGSDAYYRKNRNIDDALAAETRQENRPTKTPGDSLFTDLDNAIDESRERAASEQAQNYRRSQEQYQKEQERQEQLSSDQYRREQARQEQLRQQQLRQQQLRQEQYRREQARQEQLRQEQLKQQLRQEQLRQQKGKVKDFSAGVYSFNPDQPYMSLHSGHVTQLERKTVSHAAPFIPQETAPPVQDKAYSEPAPVPPAAAEIPHDAVPAETETAYKNSAGTSAALEKTHVKEEPDIHGTGRENRKGKSHAGIIIALICALAIGAALFILIRRFSSSLTGLVNGTPAAGTTSEVTTTSGESTVDTENDSASESAAAQGADSEAAQSEEEEESQTAESGAAENESGEEIPEDPTDISYLASVNEKAAEDAMADLDPQAPRLYLSSYGLKISAGTSFNALAYVEKIEDDADDKDRLFRDISVDGLDTFDAHTPGTYELIYFCYDSAGNRSNRAKMTVIVE